MFFVVPSFLRVFVGHLMILNLHQEEVCCTKIHILLFKIFTRTKFSLFYPVSCFDHCTYCSSLQIKFLSNYRVHQEMLVSGVRCHLVLILVTLNLTVTSQAGVFFCPSRFILYCILLIMLEKQHLTLRMPAVGAAGPLAASILWMFPSQFLIGIITLRKHNEKFQVHSNADCVTDASHRNLLGDLGPS